MLVLGQIITNDLEYLAHTVSTVREKQGILALLLACLALVTVQYQKAFSPCTTGCNNLLLWVHSMAAIGQ